MRPIKLTISAFGPYAKETEIILDELGERGVMFIAHHFFGDHLRLMFWQHSGLHK